MKITVIFLIFLLLGSNVCWIYSSVVQAVSHGYLAVSLDDSTQALDQTLSIIPLFSSGHATRKDLIAHFKNKFGMNDGFEKDGFLWIGQIGLKFNDQDKLIEVQRGWSYP